MRRPQVLIVEDEPHIVLSLELLLQRAGYAACPPVRHVYPPAPEGDRLRDSASRLDLLLIRSLWRAALRT